jgi:putative ABC transport system permease protein
MSDFIPGQFASKNPVIPEGFSQEQSILSDNIYVDDQFLSALDIELVEGRGFSPERLSDTSSSVLINETAVKKFGWEQPIGKILALPGGETPEDIDRYTVIGVVKDFHLKSLHTEIEPLYIRYTTENMDVLSVRIDPENISHTMGLLKDKWNRVTGGYPFEYYFLDDSFNELYQRDEKLVQITFVFSGLAILIGCLGLLGLTAFILERRFKEIAIRKVLGASVFRIVSIFCKEFVGLIIIASLIAWPVSYYFLNRWLQDFAYRTNIGAIVFVVASFVALVIAISTIAALAIKAAWANPVDSIRHE